MNIKNALAEIDKISTSMQVMGRLNLNLYDLRSVIQALAEPERKEPCAIFGNSKEDIYTLKDGEPINHIKGDFSDPIVGGHVEGCDHEWIWSNNMGLYFCNKCNRTTYLGKNVSYSAESSKPHDSTKDPIREVYEKYKFCSIDYIQAQEMWAAIKKHCEEK